jgi:hypothetical protein
VKKTLPSVEHVETLSLIAMRRLVGGLVEELHALKPRSRHCEPTMKLCRRTMPSCGWTMIG